MAVVVKWYGKEYNKWLYNKIDNLIEKASEVIKEKAKSNCPVKSGKLRNSIVIEKNRQMNYRVQTDVDYALYVEYGTKRSSAQPYFRPAVNSTKRI